MGYRLWVIGYRNKINKSFVSSLITDYRLLVIESKQFNDSTNQQIICQFTDH